MWSAPPHLQSSPVHAGAWYLTVALLLKCCRAAEVIDRYSTDIQSLQHGHQRPQRAPHLSTSCASRYPCSGKASTRPVAPATAPATTRMSTVEKYVHEVSSHTCKQSSSSSARNPCAYPHHEVGPLCRLLDYLTIMWTGGASSFISGSTSYPEPDPRLPYRQMVSVEMYAQLRHSGSMGGIPCCCVAYWLRHMVLGDLLLSPAFIVQAVRCFCASGLLVRTFFSLRQDTFAAAFGPMPLGAAITSAPLAAAYSRC